MRFVFRQSHTPIWPPKKAIAASRPSGLNCQNGVPRPNPLAAIKVAPSVARRTMALR